MNNHVFVPEDQLFSPEEKKKTLLERYAVKETQAISRKDILYEMIRDYKQAIIDLQKLISFLEIQSQECS